MYPIGIQYKGYFFLDSEKGRAPKRFKGYVIEQVLMISLATLSPPHLSIAKYTFSLSLATGGSN
jgi:hypothetical protein